ncbi:MAG: hypothetical protein WA637_01925 [Terriglobales bacterium]
MNQVKLIEETFAPTPKKKIDTKLTDPLLSIEEEGVPTGTRIDVEEVLGDEWDFGVSAMTTDAIRILIAGE